MTTRQKSPQICAFTLIEVLVSLGIIAVVAIPAFSLMILGVDSNAESQKSVQMTQIVDQISREVQQENFSTLPDSYPLQYFNTEAVRMEDFGDDTFYVVKVQIDRSVLLPGNVSPTGNLARVIIDIATNNGGKSPEGLFSSDIQENLTTPGSRRYQIFFSRND